MKLNGAMRCAMGTAVYEAVSGAVARNMNRAVDQTVNRARDVSRVQDVEWVLKWAVNDAVRDDPPHPNLRRFLAAVRKAAP